MQPETAEPATAESAQPPPTDPPSEPKTPYTKRVREAVHKIAWAMEDKEGRPIGAGDRAALRRMQDGKPDGMVFWKIAARYLEPEGLLLARDDPSRTAVERAWAAVLATAARLEGQHRRNFKLGRALAEAGVSEARIQRLYAAHGDALLDALRGVVHQLASSGHLVDLGDIAELVLSDGSDLEHEGVLWEDSVRHELALDFYRHHKD